MRTVDDINNPYRGSHTVFRHEYENRDVVAEFAVRRCFRGEPHEEAQIEASIERRHRTRTTSQHMSICMPPHEAQAFALAIAPELGDVIAGLLEAFELARDNCTDRVDFSGTTWPAAAKALLATAKPQG